VSSSRVPLWKQRGAASPFARLFEVVPIQWRHHWIFNLIQITAVATAIWWGWHTPVAGFAIGALSVVAAAMSVHAEMRWWQKFAWMLLIGAFLTIEFRAISKDRHDSSVAEAQRSKEEASRFSEIVNKFAASAQESQGDFRETMSRLNATLDHVDDSIKTQTGGDSFAYLTFTPQPNQQFVVAITSRGRYPLREIHITLVDEERQRRAMQQFSGQSQEGFIAAVRTGDTYFQVPYLRPQSREAPNGDVEMLGSYPFGANDSNDFTIVFSSTNGFWNERLHLRKINGQWHQALKVMGPTVRQELHPFIYTDSDFPDGKALAEKDWPRIIPQPTRH